MKGVLKDFVTVWAEAARATAASPRVTCLVWQRFPPLCTFGASGAIASAMEVTGFSTSYSTRIFSFAAFRMASVSATTRHTASPTQRVMSPTSIITSQSCCRWPTLLCGTSFAVSTPTTPSIASASEASMETTRARA